MPAFLLLVLRMIIVPLLLLIIILVMTPVSEMKDHKDWLADISGCSKDQIEAGTCPMESVCWACPLFETAFDAISQLGARVFLQISSGALTILAIGFALWLVWTTLIFVGSMQQPKAEDYYKEIATRLFLGLLVASLLGAHSGAGDSTEMIEWIFSYTIAPLLDFSMGISLTVFGGQDCAALSAFEYGGGASTGADKIFSEEIRHSASCMIGMANLLLLSGASAGYSLMMFATLNILYLR